MESQGDKKRSRKGLLKQKEEPPLYFNSQLSGRNQYRRLRQAAINASFSISERNSPEPRSAKVRFSTSPTDRYSVMTYGDSSPLSPTPLSTSPVKDSPVRSILKKTRFSLRLQSVKQSPGPSNPLDSPGKRLNSSHLLTLDKIVGELSPVKMIGLRGIIAKCREKTREFYQEMSRQAGMTDEEIREEMEHRALLQRVIREKRHQRRANSFQGLSRFTRRK